MHLLAGTLATTSNGGGGVESIASAVETFGREAFRFLNVMTRPEELIEMLSTTTDDTTGRLVLGVMIVILGLLCVINGYRWHKWVCVILSFMVGVWLGHVLSNDMAASRVIAAAVGVLCAIISTPLLRFTVAIFGGVSGAFIGTNAWAAVAGPADAQWAGAIFGFTVMAMLSFMLFKFVVMVWTSVSGAAMIVFGGLSLLLLVGDWQAPISDSLSQSPLVIPLLVLVAAVCGFVLQNSRAKLAADDHDD